jgi:hypothetical protein
MGFDAIQLAQDVDQFSFTVMTNMVTPLLVYGDAFQWAKYGHHILQSNLDLTNHNIAGPQQPFWNSLIEFLCTDLDLNLVPSNLDLTSQNKAGLHQTFQKSLVEFLCTDVFEFFCTGLDGNLFHLESSYRFQAASFFINIA